MTPEQIDAREREYLIEHGLCFESAAEVIGELRHLTAALDVRERETASVENERDYWMGEYAAMSVRAEKAEKALRDATSDAHHAHHELAIMRQAADAREREVATMRAALEWYADKKNWTDEGVAVMTFYPGGWVGASDYQDADYTCDNGECARAALAAPPQRSATGEGA